SDSILPIEVGDYQVRSRDWPLAVSIAPWQRVTTLRSASDPHKSEGSRACRSLFAFCYPHDLAVPPSVLARWVPPSRVGVPNLRFVPCITTAETRLGSSRGVAGRTYMATEARYEAA